MKGKALAKPYKPGTDVSIAGIKEAMVEAISDADYETFTGCIAILLDKYDYHEITKATGLTKSTLYRMSEPDSNPTLDNIFKVINFINSLEYSEAV